MSAKAFATLFKVGLRICFFVDILEALAHGNAVGYHLGTPFQGVLHCAILQRLRSHTHTNTGRRSPCTDVHVQMSSAQAGWQECFAGMTYASCP